MVRVYVPWLELTKRGTPGPLRTLIAPALAKSGVDELGSPIARCVECPARRPRGYVAKAPPQNAAAITRLDDPTLLFPRLDADLAQRRIVLRSFSSLHRKLLLRAAEGASFGERAQRADDDVPEALADADALRGPVFGDMVHAVLEGVDFAAVGRAATPEALLTPGGPLDTLLHEQLARNLPRLRTRARGVDLAELCRAQITGLVWKALHTPLADLGGPLWQVSPHDRLHELEFHFPEATEQPPPPETQHEEGFLTGIMDLVVRRGERVFLVDWKTNYLTGYTPADVAQAMADCDYVRQYRLYLQALARWIGRVRGKAFSFERDFGGVYYLFLRGLNGRDESTGVYFQQPKAEDLRLDLVLAEQ